MVARDGVEPERTDRAYVARLNRVTANRSRRQPGATSLGPMPGWPSCPSGLDRDARRSRHGPAAALGATFLAAPAEGAWIRQRLDSGLVFLAQENPAARGGSLRPGQSRESLGA